MTSLFESEERKNRIGAFPLAARMRPNTLAEFVGQEHFLGEGRLLRRLLAADRLGSCIFCGPPGTGKTTLAYLLAKESRSVFRQLSAVADGVKALREILQVAKERLLTQGGRTLLFIDEIHRFNKAQQDVLLPEVEQGVVTLIGATTENPFFTINNALLSRSRVFQFEPLSTDDIITLVRRAASDVERGLGRYEISLCDDALKWLAEVSDGDARRALSTLEVGVLSSLDRFDDESSGGDHGKKTSPQQKRFKPVEFTKQLAAESMQKRLMGHDRDGDSHYDIISALIKSLRGSDPDAAIYWLARMLDGGEEVRFLARRLVILASEDVGNADPAALPLAVACATACEMVGLPECQLNLAQTVIYLACAPKSNAATTAIFAAKADLANGRILPVPRPLRDSHYQGAEQFGHTGYKYAHDYEGGIVAADYLGVERQYYVPTDRGYEATLRERLEKIRAILQTAKPPTEKTDRPSTPRRILMRKPRIIVVGSSNTDMVIKSERIPIPGETILGGEFVMAAGGKGANQAVAAARLGGDVLFVARVGDDALGCQAIAGYQAEGIDTTFVAVDSRRATGVALILVDAHGENLISVAPGANAALSPADVDRATAKIANADMVVVQLETPLDTIAYVAKWGASKGIPVILDPAPAPNEPLPAAILESITYIKPNETEASRLTGIPVTDRASALVAAQKLIQWGVRGVIVTLGKEGALVVERDQEPVHVSAEVVEAVDATAAGDCFSGAMAVALGGGKSLADAARFAARCASKSVTRLGAQPSLPTLAEVTENSEKI